MTSLPSAVISWIPRSRGGRQSPPPGPVYIAPARFEDDLKWPHEAWSLVVEFQRTMHDGRYVFARIHFLVPEAPAELLQEGGRFELMEGHRRVAKGVIVPSDVEIPAELNSFETALIG